MNSVLQDSYFSKFLTLKADVQYSKATETKFQDLKQLYKKKNSLHINSVFLFSCICVCVCVYIYIYIYIYIYSNMKDI